MRIVELFNQRTRRWRAIRSVVVGALGLILVAACTSGGSPRARQWHDSVPLPDNNPGHVIPGQTACGGAGQCACDYQGDSSILLCPQCPQTPTSCNYCQSDQWCNPDPCSEDYVVGLGCFTRTTLPCPDGYAHDCKDGYCCPSEYPVCCAGGTGCGEIGSDCNADPSGGTGTSCEPDCAPGTGVKAFSFTGGQQLFTVPPGVMSVSVKLWGAGGSGFFWDGSAGTSGAGGFSTHPQLAVVPGEKLTVLVGGGGQCATSVDGGTSGASGGGRSALQRSGEDIISAGGGGGGCGGYDQKGVGGSGGGASGEPGTGSNVGQGGSQTAGGAGAFGGAAGTKYQGASSNGIDHFSKQKLVIGGFGGGGNAGVDYSANLAYCGGGGGYFGGGGSAYCGKGASGCGGGSGYVPSGGTTVAGAAGQPPATDDPDYPGGQVGKPGAGREWGHNGYVVISY